MSGAANGQPAGVQVDAGSAPLQTCSFKLRFARCRELGRSDVSLLKPFGLPSTVTDKFYSRPSQPATDATREQAALRRIQDMFRLGPREKYPRPITTSHQYGWHWQAACRESAADRRLQHHIRDSEWLKTRIRILHADTLLNQR